MNETTKGYKKWFVKQLVKEYGIFLIMLLFLIIFIATRALTPLFVGDVFDELDKANPSLMGVFNTAIWIAVSGVVRTISDFLQSYYNEVTAHKVTMNVTEDFYEEMLAKSQEFHDRVKVGDVMARATYDTRQMNIFISPGLKFLLEAFFTIVFCVGLMIYIHPKLNLLLVGALPFYIIAILHYNKRLRPISKAQMEQNSAINSRLQESITGIRVIRAFVKEDDEIEEFDKETEKLREINTERGIISAKYYAVVITVIVVGTSFLWGAYEVSLGNITRGDLITYVMLAMNLRMPTWQIGWGITQMQIGMAASRRIYEMKEREEYVPNPEVPIEWTLQEGKVIFEEVTFSYNGDSSRRKALDNISFEVPAGSTAAIIGNPGSGKSTLMKLLMRLYDPSEGAIYIDDINIKEMKISNLRDNIGVIEQEVFLYSKTILENIRYGKPKASREEVIEAAKLAQAHDFIMEFEEEYETVVGERGVTLSGGQKQRVAIARALLVDPTILVLDDASSAIDAETERQIQTAIANVLKERTTFIITHRLATIKNADLIIVLRDGKLIDVGNHSELLLRNIDYRRLFERFSKFPPMQTVEAQ
ncbi:MAG: ABC transporter ATP-binding protein [Asgard group archaeon]|nr:ABC transporter ATP-binding protein [Asgard group archaeon]